MRGPTVSITASASVEGIVVDSSSTEISGSSFSVTDSTSSIRVMVKFSSAGFSVVVVIRFFLQREKL